jgi:hypothetical protein
MIPTGEFEGYAIVFASRRDHCQARLLAHLHAHPRPRSINSNGYFLGAGTPDPFQRLRASTGPGVPLCSSSHGDGVVEWRPVK